MQAKANLTAIAFMIAAMLGFAIEDAFIKALMAHLVAGQVLALIGLGGTLAFVVICWRRGIALNLRMLANKWVLLRTFSELIGTMFFVTSLALVPLVTVSAIIQMAPLLVTMGAAFLLKEQVGPRRWAAIVLGMIGMLIILQPWTTSFAPASLLTVGGVIGLSLRDIATRRIPDGVNTLSLATLGFGAVIPAGLFLSLFNAPWAVPTPIEWAYLVLCVVIGIVSYYAIITAMRIGEVAVVTPFRYSRLIFGSAIEVMFFSEIITPQLIAGSLLIIATGLYTLWRERQLAQG